MAKKELTVTPKQSALISEYMVDYKGTAAALRAGYSPKSAAAQASIVLGLPHVQKEMVKRQGKIARKLDISAERVLEELGRIAFADVRELFDDNGNLIPIPELSRKVAATLAGVDIVAKEGDPDAKGVRRTEYSYKIKTWDKIAALEKLAKHLGMFKEESAKMDINITIEGRDADCG